MAQWVRVHHVHLASQVEPPEWMCPSGLRIPAVLRKASFITPGLGGLWYTLHCGFESTEWENAQWAFGIYDVITLVY